MTARMDPERNFVFGDLHLNVNRFKVRKNSGERFEMSKL